MQGETIVELKNISKSFPGVKALDGVNFSLRKGSVHGLVGENGAGKSTLMKILSGTYASYEGEIILNGSRVNFKNEKEAMQAGISIVPQELNYVPELTIEENIFMGREPTGRIRWVLDKKTRAREAAKLIEGMGLALNPKMRMYELNVAQRQMVEIMKAISRQARVIILDEPTSSLTEVETKQLFGHIERMRDEGIAIIYISHKLEEVFQLCDQISVLRDSRFIGSMPREEATYHKVISMMVGREVDDMYPHIEEHSEEEILRVEHLTQENVFDDISFSLRKGEILGFSGMMGAGRSETLRAIFGIDSYQSGSIFVEGKLVAIRKPGDAIRHGIGMVTEDRANYGFVGGMSVSRNIALPNMDTMAPGGILNQRIIREKVEKIRQDISIKVSTIEDLVQNLSGGNQQKVVLAKWLVREIKILILDEPTRGIDIGAKQEIYHLLKELAAQGMGIVMISSEMQEVIGMSHRIVVMDGGRILGELSGEEMTQDNIMGLIIKGGRQI